MINNYKVLCLKNYELPMNGPFYENHVAYYEGEIYDAEVDEGELYLKWTIISDMKDEIYFGDEEIKEYFIISVKETRKEKLKNIDAKSNM
jgi:hypothetical protein